MAEMISPCDDGCNLEFDVDQAIDIYNKLTIAINDDLDTYYEAGRINGATWAEMATALKSKAIDSAINAVTQLQMKETPMDRAVKQEQIDASQSKTVRDDELGDKSMEVSDEQITASIAKTVRDDDLESAQANNARVKTFLTIEKDYGYTTAVLENGNSLPEADQSNGKIDGEINLLAAQAATEVSRAAKVDYEVSNILPAQENLTKRQIIGFDDNKTLKGFNAGMSAWGLAFSSGLMEEFPSFVTDDSMTTTYNFLNAPTTIP